MNEKGLSEALALLREIRDVGECSIDRWKRIDAFLASRQDEQHPEQAEGAQDEREAFILRMIEDRDISRTMAAYMWDSRQPAPAPELERPEVVAWLHENGTLTDYQDYDSKPLMTVAQHERILRQALGGHDDDQSK